MSMLKTMWLKALYFALRVQQALWNVYLQVLLTDLTSTGYVYKMRKNIHVYEDEPTISLDCI